MDPLIAAGISVTVLAILIIIGIHIGFALPISSIIGLWLVIGDFRIAYQLVGTTAFYAVNSYVFGTIPLFVLMGILAGLSGAAEDLFILAHTLLAKVRGGLGIATVIANAVFAAVTGVSLASIAVFSKIAIPQMVGHGFDRRFAIGTVIGSSALGMLIPPSALLIVYGILSEQSIGKLFFAGIIPGIVMTICLSGGILAMVAWRPHLAPKATSIPISGCRGLGTLLFRTWPIIALVFLVLGGIYMGWFTPTEAGAVGAFGALMMALIRRRLSFKNMWGSLLETGVATSSIFFLFIGAQMYGRMLATSGLASKISELAIGLPVPPIVIIIGFMVILLILGCLVDGVSMLLLTMPIFLPVVTGLGYDLIWFGIICVIAVEMGFITPPLGLAIYAMKGFIGELATIEDIFMGSFPFLIFLGATLVIVIAFPILSTWIPSLM